MSEDAIIKVRFPFREIPIPAGSKIMPPPGYEHYTDENGILRVRPINTQSSR